MKNAWSIISRIICVLLTFVVFITMLAYLMTSVIKKSLTKDFIKDVLSQISGSELPILGGKGPESTSHPDTSPTLEPSAGAMSYYSGMLGTDSFQRTDIDDFIDFFDDDDIDDHDSDESSQSIYEKYDIPADTSLEDAILIIIEKNGLDPEPIRKLLKSDIVSKFTADYIQQMLDYIADGTKIPERITSETIKKYIQDNKVEIEQESGLKITDADMLQVFSTIDTYSEDIDKAMPDPVKLKEGVMKSAPYIKSAIKAFGIIVSKKIQTGLLIVLIVLLLIMGLLLFSPYKPFIWFGIPVFLAGGLFAILGLIMRPLVSLANGIIKNELFENITKNLLDSIVDLTVKYGLIALAVGLGCIAVFIVGCIVDSRLRSSKEQQLSTGEITQ